jgi:hypothetical protein
MTELDRLRIAADIVRRADSVTLLTPEEVDDIYARVGRGEFDDYDSITVSLPYRNRGDYRSRYERGEGYGS